jgi:alkanal monooxygenase alpha chain
MKWGVYITTAQPPEWGQRDVIQRSLEYASAAEEMGYDAVWLLEHHFTRYGLCGSPLTMAAHILGRTRKLKVGTAISTIPLEHPLRLAEEVALIDQMSGGRLYFGIGRGSFVKDFKIFGVDMGRSREIMSEWVEIMLTAWTTGKCSADGEFVKFSEVPIYPEPFTKPHPPIYVVATSPTTIEWAAERGYPLILNFLLEDETKTSQIELYNDTAEANGHDSSQIDHVLSCLCSIGDDSAQVKESVRPLMGWWMEELVRASELYAPENRNLPSYTHHQRRWEEMVISGVTTTDRRVDRAIRLNPVGSPQEVIDKIQRTVDLTGIRHFACGFETNKDKAAVLEMMQRVQEEVVPKIVPRGG